MPGGSVRRGIWPPTQCPSARVPRSSNCVRSSRMGISFASAPGLRISAPPGRRRGPPRTPGVGSRRRGAHTRSQRLAPYRTRRVLTGLSVSRPYGYRCPPIGALRAPPAGNYQTPTVRRPPNIPSIRARSSAPRYSNPMWSGTPVCGDLGPRAPTDKVSRHIAGSPTSQKFTRPGLSVGDPGRDRLRRRLLCEYDADNACGSPSLGLLKPAHAATGNTDCGPAGSPISGSGAL